AGLWRRRDRLRCRRLDQVGFLGCRGFFLALALPPDAGVVGRPLELRVGDIHLAGAHRDGDRAAWAGFGPAGGRLRDHRADRHGAAGRRGDGDNEPIGLERRSGLGLRLPDHVGHRDGRRSLPGRACPGPGGPCAGGPGCHGVPPQFVVVLPFCCTASSITWVMFAATALLALNVSLSVCALTAVWSAALANAVRPAPAAPISAVSMRMAAVSPLTAAMSAETLAPAGAPMRS